MNSGFVKIRQGNCTLLINKDFRNSTLEQALSAGQKTLQEHYELTPVLSSSSSRVYKFSTSFNGAERAIYFKRYLFRSNWDFIKHLVRSSRAKRAFKASLILEKNGFETPVIIAVGEHRASFLDRGNFLVTLEVEGAKQIYQFIPNRTDDLTKEQLRAKRRLLRAFGQTVGRMHAAGIFHGDLRLGNILAKEENHGWHFFLIDNERTRKFRRLPARLRLKNLVQVNMLNSDGVTKTDRMRFFKSYLQINADIQDRYKKLAKKVNAKTRERLRTKIPKDRL